MSDERRGSNEPSEIQQVYQRLLGRNHLRTLLGRPKTSDDELIDMVFGTPVARSEIFIGEDERRRLNARIDQISNFVSRTGQDLTNAPWYFDDLAAGDITPDEAKKRIFRTYGDFDMVFTDSEPLPSDANSSKLFFAHDDKLNGRDVTIRFSHDDTFLLEIEFIDPSTNRVAFRYKTKENTPVDEMTKEEYRIVDHYLDKYINEVMRERAN